MFALIGELQEAMKLVETLFADVRKNAEEIEEQSNKIDIKTKIDEIVALEAANEQMRAFLHHQEEQDVDKQENSVFF